jgi:hypothetical protein
MQIPSRVSCTSRPFGKVIQIPLTFPPVHKLKVIVLPVHVALTMLEKNYNPLYSTTHQLFWGFYSSSEPPFLLVLQLHTTHSSLLRFKIFLHLWTLVKFCPIIMRLAVHNLQTFVPAVLTRLMVFQRKRMWTLMWVRHYSATSAFVLNRRCFTWAKR